MQLCANKLDKKDFFGKSDPFLVFYRSNEDGTWVWVLKGVFSVLPITNEHLFFSFPPLLFPGSCSLKCWQQTQMFFRFSSSVFSPYLWLFAAFSHYLYCNFPHPSLETKSKSFALKDYSLNSCTWEQYMSTP